MRKLRGLGPLLSLPLLALAIYVVHRELSNFHWTEVRLALAARSTQAVFGALLFTFFSFLALTGYDALGLRYARRSLPYRQSAFASFISYAFSQALGFPLLTGGSLRLRLYSGWGLTGAEIRDVVAFCSATLWLGFFALAGTVLIWEPLRLPTLLHLPFDNARPLGILLLALALAYVVWAARARNPVRVGEWEIRAPGPRLTAVQLLLSACDWILACAVLYVLLPAGFTLNFPAFLGVFLLAQIAGVLSHVPGGIGVFEAVLLLFLPADIPQSAFLAALLLYRGIYYLIPLLAAVAALGLYELLRRKEQLARAATTMGGVSLIVPHAMAFATFVGGLLLLFSGATPALHGRLARLSGVLPLPIIEVSHFVASLAGAGLLLLARGIQRRLDGAWHLAVILLATAIVFSLLKGLDYEEAAALTIVLLALLASRREFYRRAAILVEPFSLSWSAAVAGAMFAAIGLGLLAHRHIVYTDELWWRFALNGDAPRFLRGSVGALIVVLGFAFAHLLTPAAPAAAAPSPEDTRQAGDIARRSTRANAQLAILGDKHFLFNAKRSAFIMYAVQGRSWIALGDPVGPEDEAAELVWQFRELTDRHHDWPVFYQVRPGSLPLYIDQGLTLTKLGEEARVNLPAMSMEGGGRKSQRRLLRKLEEEGAHFRVIPAGEVHAQLPELKAVSDDWLLRKKVREKGFSLGFFAETYLEQTAIAVIEVNGAIVAFANLLASDDRAELTVDLMRYAETAPPSVMEFLLLRTMLHGRELGFEWFNLGMAPLSGLESRPLAPLWNRFGAALFRWGENFYNFEGLREFKQKFDPVWEPRYLASPGGLALPRVLANVSTLISGGVRGVIAR